MLNVLGIEFGPEVAASAQAGFPRNAAPRASCAPLRTSSARLRALNEAGRNRAVERLFGRRRARRAYRRLRGAASPGFHRGALAGITEAERAAAFDERFDAWDEGRF